MTDTERMIDALLGVLWRLSLWADLAERIQSARIVLAYVDPGHAAIEDLRLLAAIVDARR